MNFITYLLFTFCFWTQGLVTEYNTRICQHRFFIVIDGGSSGTRLNVFMFDNEENNPKLKNTFIHRSKVALSSFSNFREDWNLMRIMINNLTNIASTFIPEECIKDTPLYLQVTAGIRQIERSMGSRILNHVKSILLKSRFIFKPKFVAVLTTAQEGQLAWISINFILENLRTNTTEIPETLGILDLGGGSTQIAFATENPELMKRSTKINVLGQDYYIYSHGYDYMGINEARLKYFNVKTCSQSQCPKRVVRSQCLHPEVITNYHIGNRTLIIGGQIIGNRKRFCHCFGKSLKFTRNVATVRNFFGTKKFVAFSAFYYILKNAGNIFKMNSMELYETNIRNIIIRAMELCESPFEVSKSNRFGHFLCMDLSYMVALLHNGYGFEWYDELISSMKIKGNSLSWALGYAISQF